MMLRTLSRTVTAANRAGNAWNRNSSSAPPGSSGGGGGGGKVVLGVGVAAATVIGGTVAYAGVDKDFRKTIESNVPGSPSVLSAILGDLEPEKKPVKRTPFPAKLPVTSSISAPPSKLRPASQQPTEESSVKSESKAGPSMALPPPPPIDLPTEEVKKDSGKDKSPKPGDDTKGPSATIKEDAKSKPSEAVVEKSHAEPSKAATMKHEEPSKSSTSSSDESFLHEKDLHRRLVVLREELETEMRSQLKRQSQAHSDHVADALDVQKRELLRKHARELDEAVEQTALAQRRELAGLVGHVRGLQLALEHRAEMDMSALEAQELWLACSALQRALDDSESAAAASGKRSLSAELASLRGVLKKRSDGYVSAILESLPKAVADEGVVSESSVRERFLKVERLARRTALIGEEGGSLMRYLLSYAQSLFVLRPSTEDIPSKHDALDLDVLTTFDIVWLARASLDRGDLEQAVRYMTLLRGEPRRVAATWLDDARVLLELRQACRALVAHAGAVGVEALPERHAKQPS